MRYHVCVQNCFEDSYCENTYITHFSSLEEAIEHIQGHTYSIFLLAGGIKDYFAECASETDERIVSYCSDYIDCYQIINIIPSEKMSEEINTCFCDDSRSVFSNTRTYSMTLSGNVIW